ncbi:DUF2092 domain-containing protein [Parasedimentitalea psychrophila]|uniref:DUF2092 domain-containing protein n=1 Tax=Parasedimentitalea psychrophila TaxID=2997337 RepID=A0A9Y2KZ91_9RHOB|nr:DUF2092 domain-containing protein [Parasedimentitalea psychrophila]WIY23914.1 DUF2092 domain-containing protein [Parasedimentitalea psychrophila]
MFWMSKNLLTSVTGKLSGPAAILVLGLIAPAETLADEADARSILKSMSDYVASQDAISFGFDANLEVVTKDGQRLALASSGTVSLNRPENFHTARAGGFADIETFFDGKTLTLLGKTANVYVQVDAPGSVDDLVEMMETKLDRSPPAAHLILSNSYDQLMQGVTNVKDLGSGVIGGVECDFLAFRADEVDWQIWIAHGDKPYPCRYVVTSKKIAGAPQYSIQINNWATGSDVITEEFTFENTTDATQIDVADLRSKMSELPGHFKTGE